MAVAGATPDDHETRSRMVPMDPASLPRSVDAVIIGGGLAGLSCAVALAERGVLVLVLERERVLGGRARSWVDATTGDPVHIGPHILLSTYPNMRALLRRLGSEGRVRWQTDAFIHLVEGSRCHVVPPIANLPPPLHLLPSLGQTPGLSRRDLLVILRAAWSALRAREEELLALDDETALVWLRRMGATEPSIRRFWSFIVTSILNVPIELCSAGALARLYREMVGHNQVDVGLPTCGLGDLFVPQAQQLLTTCGSVVATDAPVRSIRCDRGRVTGVTLADGRPVDAPWVVSTVPPANLRPLLPAAWRAAPVFTDLGVFVPCPYISTYLWFADKLTDRPFWARVPAAGGLSHDFYDLSNLPPGWPTDRSLVATNIIWSHRATELADAEIVAETRRELAEFLPAAATSPIRHARVHRIPLAIHCPFPGVERRRLTTRSPIQGLLLAGDWVRTGIPASMEGACRSGHLAAEQILRARRVEATLAHEVPEIGGLARWLHALRGPWAA